MFEFLNAPIACIIVAVIMILIAEFNIRFNQNTEEQEVVHASED